MSSAAIAHPLQACQARTSAEGERAEGLEKVKGKAKEERGEEEEYREERGEGEQSSHSPACSALQQ